MLVTPGPNAGLAGDGIASASGGAGALAITLSAPDLPAGWAITKAHCVAIIDADPHTSQDYNMAYAFDAVTPYVPTFAGLPTGTYNAYAFFEFTKPDSSIAYSPS